MKLTASMMLTLVESRPLVSGVMLQTYRLAGRPSFGSAG